MGTEHWAEASLGKLCIINPRHNIENEYLDVTFVTMSDLSTDSPDFENFQIRPLIEVKKGFTHFEENDILFAKITPCMENGKAAIAKNLKNGLGCGTTELHVIRPPQLMDSKLIYHFIHQPLFRKDAEHHFTGTAGQQRVPLQFISNYLFPLPPLNEQKRIVEKLDSILPKVKDTKKRLQKIPAILKKFRQSVLAAACSGRLTEDWRVGKDLPEWQETYLGEILVNIEAGKSVKCIEKPPKHHEIGIVKVSSVSWGTFLEDESKTLIDNKIYNANYIINEYDFLFSRANTLELVGACVIVGKLNRKLMLSDKILRFTFQGRVIPHWILYSLRSAQGRDQIEELATGNQPAMKNISQDKIKQINVNLPPLREQQEIIRRVEKLFILADSLEAKYRKAMKRVEKLEQSILAKAFRGELVDPDPDDEPAEELLKRILAEKEKLEESLKSKKKKTRVMQHS